MGHGDVGNPPPFAGVITVIELSLLMVRPVAPMRPVSNDNCFTMNFPEAGQHIPEGESLEYFSGNAIGHDATCALHAHMSKR